MRKMTGFRLPVDTVKMLAALSAYQGVNMTSVLILLIRESYRANEQKILLTIGAGQNPPEK